MKTENTLPIVDCRWPMARNPRALTPNSVSRTATAAPRTSHSESAFTLIEIMVVVVLLAVIILGLTAMFVETQRAFRAGMAQTDVLEAGRMATEMISRELEQVTPGYAYNPGYWSPARYAPNMVSQLGASFVQPLVANPGSRTNIQDDIFFLTHENQTWHGIGYFVRSNETLVALTPTTLGPVGTLYRFEWQQSDRQFTARPDLMYAIFNDTRSGNNPTNFSKVMDGVIGFKVRAYDVTNNWITPYLLGVIATNYTMITNGNVILSPLTLVQDEVGNTQFYSNAVPAFIEFELAVLEQSTFARYKSIPIYDAQTNYLASQAGRVHVFRQRVAVRNVDPAAY